VSTGVGTGDDSHMFCSRFQTFVIDMAGLSRSTLALRACGYSVHGHTIGEFLDDVAVERDVSVLEFWAGVGSVAGSAAERGLVTHAIEKDAAPHDAEFDLLSAIGFLHAVALVLRLKIGGLLFLAPVCSSFCWLSLSQTKRSPENDFRGDQTNENVREGNRGAEVATFLFVLAWARSAEACLENPPGSKIWKYPPLVNMQETLMLGRSSLHTAVVNRCVFDTTSPIGEKYGKKYKFLATGAWVESETLTAKCSCPQGVHRKLVDRFGEKAVRGRSADLVASQAYPKKLGVAIVDAWLGAPSTVSVLPSSSPSDTGVVSQSSGVLGQRRPSSSWCTPGSDDDSPPCTRPAPPCAKRPRRWAASSSDSPAVAHPKVAHRKVATARPRQWQAADSGSS
jgi:hypothetical protein